MLPLKEMQASLRKQSAKTAGEDGEKYAFEWLKSSGWKF